MKPVSKTAYYCCGCRMHDAQSDYPVIGDYYAEKFMDEQAMKYWDELKGFTFPLAGNKARHYIIETMLRKLLFEHPRATVIQVGAGLDTRAFRLYSGNWLEIDAPEVIKLKGSILPASSCLNPLQRIPLDFERESLQEKLAEFSDRENVIVVIEGVWFYLTHEEREATLKALTRTFPKHILICDLMTRYFFEKLAKPLHQKLVGLGTTFRDVEEQPHERVLASGYSLVQKKSMIKTSRDLALNGIKGLVSHLMPEKLQMGYSVHRFEYAARA